MIRGGGGDKTWRGNMINRGRKNRRALLAGNVKQLQEIVGTTMGTCNIWLTYIIP
jgi:hypothetical protein